MENAKEKINWHRTEEGRRFHSETMRRIWRTNRKKWPFRCAQCAKQCESTWPKAKFCEGRCKSAYYRDRDQRAARNLRTIILKQGREMDRHYMLEDRVNRYF